MRDVRIPDLGSIFVLRLCDTGYIINASGGVISMSIGERIKLRRQQLGLTVDQLADRLGKNRATVYRYESNEIENLPLSILEPLAKSLGVSPAYLMGWEVPAEAKCVPVLVAAENGSPVYGRDTF